MRRIVTTTHRAPPTIKCASTGSVELDGLGAMKKALATSDTEAPHLTFGELTIQVGQTAPTAAPQGKSPAAEARPEGPSPRQETGLLFWRDLVEVFLDAQDEAGIEALKGYIDAAERAGARFALKRNGSRENAFLTWRDGRFEVEVVAGTDSQQGGDK